MARRKVTIHPIQEKTADYADSAEKNPLIDTDFHRLKEETTEGTENTEIYLRFSAPLPPLRLCLAPWRPPPPIEQKTQKPTEDTDFCLTHVTQLSIMHLSALTLPPLRAPFPLPLGEVQGRTGV